MKCTGSNPRDRSTSVASKSVSSLLISNVCDDEISVCSRCGPHVRHVEKYYKAVTMQLLDQLRMLDRGRRSVHSPLDIMSHVPCRTDSNARRSCDSTPSDVSKNSTSCTSNVSVCSSDAHGEDSVSCPDRHRLRSRTRSQHHKSTLLNERGSRTASVHTPAFSLDKHTEHGAGAMPCRTAHQDESGPVSHGVQRDRCSPRTGAAEPDAQKQDTGRVLLQSSRAPKAVAEDDTVTSADAAMHITDSSPSRATRSGFLSSSTGSDPHRLSFLPDPTQRDLSEEWFHKGTSCVDDGAGVAQERDLREAIAQLRDTRRAVEADTQQAFSRRQHRGQNHTHRAARYGHMEAPSELYSVYSVPQTSKGAERRRSSGVEKTPTASRSTVALEERVRELEEAVQVMRTKSVHQQRVMLQILRHACVSLEGCG